jgi:hypothetical protein
MTGCRNDRRSAVAHHLIRRLRVRRCEQDSDRSKRASNGRCQQHAQQCSAVAAGTLDAHTRRLCARARGPQRQSRTHPWAVAAAPAGTAEDDRHAVTKGGADLERQAEHVAEAAHGGSAGAAAAGVVAAGVVAAVGGHGRRQGARQTAQRSCQHIGGCSGGKRRQHERHLPRDQRAAAGTFAGGAARSVNAPERL